MQVVLVPTDQAGIAGTGHVCKLKGKASPISPAMCTNFIAVGPYCPVSGLASFIDQYSDCGSIKEGELCRLSKQCLYT